MMKALGKTLTAGLLFYLGVEAARNKIEVSTWVGRDCNGHPTSYWKPAEDMCQNINAQSLVFHAPKHRHLKDWKERVNSGSERCFVTTYSVSNCHDDDAYRLDHEIPASFEKCRAFPQGVRSIKFHCRPNADTYWTTTSITTTQTAASWSMTPTNRKWTSSLFTFISTFPDTVPVSRTPTPTPSARRALEARGRGEPVHRWYLHPWSHNAVCFKCWYRHKPSNSKFQCESDEKTQGCKYLPPDRNVTTATITETPPPTTTTTTLVSTETVVLGERREHLIVAMMHPIRETLTCGKAVWQHVGNKKKEKIRIKGPHKCKGSDYRVDAPRPTTTTILTVEPPETSTITSLASTTVTMVAETQVETLTVTLGF